MKPKIGITPENLEAVGQLLGLVLADEMVLYVKTRKFHWNVAGESFMELHTLFESQYHQLEESIDQTAERISKLGMPAIGTMDVFGKLATLKESPGKYPASQEMKKELLEDHEALIIHLRKYIEQCAGTYQDSGSADFLTGLMEQHETIAWTLRRYFK